MESNKSILDLVKELQEKIKYLEEENIETTNVLYELMENIRAVDARIDILAEKWSNDDLQQSF